MPFRRIDAMLPYPHWLVESGLMPNRRAAPSSDPPPGAAGGSAKGPTREALLSALAGRERELAEAMARQTATSEILRVISQSPTDARPVFEEILGACQRLFGSDEIGVYTIGDDDMVRVAAWRGPRAEEVWHDVTPVAESITGRIIRERCTHHIPDLRAEPNLSPTVRDRVDRLGRASLLYAPMLWEDRGLGSILVVRSPPKPFTDREQALLQTFADQAAIAIQNARLFQETQEALRQQNRDERYPFGSLLLRPAICSRCSTCWWRQRAVFAEPMTPLCRCARALICDLRLITGRSLSLSSSMRSTASGRQDAPWSIAGPSMCTTSPSLETSIRSPLRCRRKWVA